MNNGLNLIIRVANKSGKSSFLQLYCAFTYLTWIDFANNFDFRLKWNVDF